MNNHEPQNVFLSRSLEAVAIVVSNKCQDEPTFDRSFRKDPEAAIRQAFGLEQGLGKQLHLHDNDENNWHIVLPDLKEREQIQHLLASGMVLSDKDVAEISGGDVILGLAVLGVFAAVTVVGIGIAGSIAGGLMGKAAADVKKGRV